MRLTRHKSVFDVKPGGRARFRFQRINVVLKNECGLSGFFNTQLAMIKVIIHRQFEVH